MFKSKNYHKPEDVLSIGDMLSLWKEVTNWCFIEEVVELDESDNATGNSIFYIRVPECYGYFKLSQSEWDKLGWRKRYCLPLEWYNRLLDRIITHLPFDSSFWRRIVYIICLHLLLRAYQGSLQSGHMIAKPEPFEWINAQYKKYNGELPPLNEIEKFQVEFFGDLPEKNKINNSEPAPEYCETLTMDRIVKTTEDNRQLIDLRNYLLNPRLWDYHPGGKVHYVCHDYAFSDSAEDDICKTCTMSTCNGKFTSPEYPMIYVEPERLTLKQDMYVRLLVDNYFPLNESFIHEYVNEGTMRTMKDNIVYESEDYAFFLINEVRSPVKDESLLPLAKEFYELLFKIHRASEDFDLKKEDE